MTRPRYEFERFSAVRKYSDVTFSPDGKWVAYSTNTSGQFNVWRQPTNIAFGGHPLMPIQLTALTQEAAQRAVWSPDGQRILTLADHHGTENFQIYEIPSDRGWLRPITNNPEVRYQIGSNPFSPDGRFIAYATNGRKPTDLDIVVHDLVTSEIRTLLAGDATYFPAAWSPDGFCLLALEIHSNTDQDIYLCSIRTGEHRHLSPHEDEVKFLPGPWKPDGRGFYLLSDQGREFVGLAFFDVKTDSIHWLVTPDWDVQDVAVSRDGRYLAWIINEDGYSRLYVRDDSAGKVRDFPDFPRGVCSHLCFNPVASQLALYLSRPMEPTNLYLLNVETGEMRWLTQSFLGGIPEAEMVNPELIRYPTFDGRMIPAFLYKPNDLKPSEQVPVVLSIHGGPEGQEVPKYAHDGFYQYLLSRNIGVLTPNIRGSSGYGKSYQKMIHRDWGGAELRDLEHAALYLRSLAWVDPNRLGVFGGSFGGFATLSCVTRLPDYWAAAVDIAGPSNLLTFARSVPQFWRRSMRQWLGDLEEDMDRLRERSPIQYLDNVHVPLLVIQGANDPRVTKAESDQMVERLKALGRTVEYLVFEDEGHGFTKTSNRLKALRASAKWFEKHLNADRH
jgi:dipeptidyl aminopeptidase/acylaminoacyl peptidase